MKKFFLLMFLLLSLPAVGRQLSGIITDETDAPLPYPTIRVKNRPIGTLGDSTGHFILSAKKLRAADTLTVSYLGYRTAEIPVSALEEHADTLNLSLDPMPVVLPDLKVSMPKKAKRQIKGNKNGRGWSLGYIDGKTAGDSYGYEFHAKKNKILILDRVGLYYCAGDSQATHIKFRLNIYDMLTEKSGRTDRFVSVLPKPIYFDFNATKGTDGRFEFVLPEQIVLPRHAIVEIEFVENLGSQKFWYKNNVLGKRTWYREVDSNVWDRQPFATPFFVECLEVPAPPATDPHYRPSALHPVQH